MGINKLQFLLNNMKKIVSNKNYKSMSKKEIKNELISCPKCCKGTMKDVGKTIRNMEKVNIYECNHCGYIFLDN